MTCLSPILVLLQFIIITLLPNVNQSFALSLLILGKKFGYVDAGDQLRQFFGKGRYYTG